MRRAATSRREIARKLVLASGLAAGSLLSTDSASAQLFTWSAGVTGNWSVAGNWLGGAVPNSTAATAFVDGGVAGDSVATINGTFSIGTLSISSGDRVTIGNGQSFTIGTALINQGTFTIGATVNTTDLLVATGSTVTHSGSGTLVMSAAPARITGSGTFVNSATIIGQGNIGANAMLLNNTGTIIASGGTLTLDPANNAFGVTNTGTLSAAAGGTLVLTGSGFGGFNNSGGTISANGGDVRLAASVVVTGGTLVTTGSSAIRTSASNTATLNGITNTGLYVGENNAATNIGTSFANSGTFAISSTGNATDMTLSGGSIEFSGGGTVILSGAAARINGSGTLANTNNLIRGRGAIGANVLSIINSPAGVIRADDNTGSLIVDGANVVDSIFNAGLMLATGGGQLTLTGSGFGAVTQTTGTIRAEDASNVMLVSGIGITGGTLSTTGSGSMNVAVSNVASLASLTQSGHFVVENNADLNLSGTINNTGSINLNGAANTTEIALTGASTVTLGGAGTVHMNGAVSRVGGIGTLVTNNFIRGQGALGSNEISVINNSTISADLNNGTQSLVMTIDPANTVIGFTNNGTLQAGTGGTMVLTGSSFGAFNNTNGQIIALSNGTVQLTSTVSVTGGTISSAATGTIEVPVSVSVSLASLTLAGNVQQGNNSLINLSGTITNTGSINVNGAASNTDIQATSAVLDLTGGGSIAMNSSTTRIYGNAGTVVINNVNNKIRGQGQIGVNTTIFHNQVGGLIDANVPGASIVLDPSNQPNAFVNDGSMQASNGGALVFTGSGFGTFTNNATITAQTGSKLQITASAFISGGTLNTVGTGSIEIPSSVSVSLANMTLAGNVQQANSSLINLSGTITNTGSINVNAGASNTDVQATSATLNLTGGGVINLNGGTARMYGSAGTAVINNVNNTIRGQGQIGVNQLMFVNQAAGVIDANVTGAAITFDPSNTGAAAFTNNGSMQASNGGVLVFTGSGFGGFTNTSTITAQTGSKVQLTGTAVMTGGTLSTVGTGTIEVPGATSASLDNVTIAGNMQVTNSSFVNLSGTITNTGSINLNSVASNTDLQATSNPLTLTGGGVINMNGASPRIYGSAGTTVINNVNNTIQGQGHLGANQLIFNNLPGGKIDANVPGGAITIDPANQNNPFVNTGTLLASTGNLTLTGSSFGTFATTGGRLIIQSAGTLNTIGSAIVAAGSVELDGVWNHSGGSSVTMTRATGAGTLVITGGEVEVNAGGGTTGTSRLAGVSAVGGRLDLTNHNMVVDYSGTSPLVQIEGNVATAYVGGAWTGNGITSSIAGASPLTDKTAVGIAEATDVFTSFPGTFDGLSVDATTVLLKFTYSGDANLSGTVNGADFNILASNFGGSGKRWGLGDFTFDGLVNSADFNSLAGNFGKTLAGGSGGGPGASVPEPGAVVGLIGIAAVLVGRRRRS